MQFVSMNLQTSLPVWTDFLLAITLDTKNSPQCYWTWHRNSASSSRFCILFDLGTTKVFIEIYHCRFRKHLFNRPNYTAHRQHQKILKWNISRKLGRMSTVTDISSPNWQHLPFAYLSLATKPMCVLATVSNASGCHMHILHLDNWNGPPKAKPPSMELMYGYKWPLTSMQSDQCF